MRRFAIAAALTLAVPTTGSATVYNYDTFTQQFIDDVISTTGSASATTTGDTLDLTLIQPDDTILLDLTAIDSQFFCIILDFKLIDFAPGSDMSVAFEFLDTSSLTFFYERTNPLKVSIKYEDENGETVLVGVTLNSLDFAGAFSYRVDNTARGLQWEHLFPPSTDPEDKKYLRGLVRFAQSLPGVTNIRLTNSGADPTFSIDRLMLDTEQAAGPHPVPLPSSAVALMLGLGLLPLSARIGRRR